MIIIRTIYFNPIEFEVIKSKLDLFYFEYYLSKIAANLGSSARYTIWPARSIWHLLSLSNIS